MLQAIHGVGIDWTFAGEAVEYGGFLVRATAVLVSLGGMLVTALMLGLVSGVPVFCLAPRPRPAPACTYHSWQGKRERAVSFTTFSACTPQTLAPARVSCTFCCREPCVVFAWPALALTLQRRSGTRLRA